VTKWKVCMVRPWFPPRKSFVQDIDFQIMFTHSHNPPTTKPICASRFQPILCLIPLSPPYPFSQSLATSTHVTMSSFCHKNLFLIMEVQRPFNGLRNIEFKSYFIECFGGWRFSLVYVNLGY
jgi:hypothetical protein